MRAPLELQLSGFGPTPNFEQPATHELPFSPLVFASHQGCGCFYKFGVHVLCVVVIRALPGLLKTSNNSKDTLTSAEKAFSLQTFRLQVLVWVYIKGHCVLETPMSATAAVSRDLQQPRIPVRNARMPL